MTGRYQVLVELLAREGRPFPRVFRRVRVTARDRVEAVRSSLAYLGAAAGDLLISVTISEIGRNGAKD